MRPHKNPVEHVSECFLLTGGQGEGKEGVWGQEEVAVRVRFVISKQSLGHLKCRVELLSWFSGETDLMMFNQKCVG